MGVTASVVVCAYTEDRWEHLVAALESVKHQTRPALEAILVIDHNPALLDRAVETFTDIRVVANTGSQGLSDARNTGVGAATGDVVAFLDDDAAAAPDWLLHLTDPFEDPAVVAVSGRAIPRWENGKPGWFPEEFNWVVGCTYLGHRVGPGPVRNVIGCNMALRRDVIEASGGFRSELGRVGTHPVGGEETELSIRAVRTRPDATVWYQPAAAVSHFVPAGRGTLAYFRSRCYAEGESKALISGMVGAGAALASERSYTLRVLPKGVLSALRSLFTNGDWSGPARAAAIVTGLAVTTAGYLRGRVAMAFDRPATAALGRFAETDDDPTPPVSVIIATRDRPDRLRRCLSSVQALAYPRFDVIVVDNAPSTDATRKLIREDFGGDPRITYVREDLPGLARAHNRGLEAATGTILAFTDDDVVVDPGWVGELVNAFADPRVGCVTGRIVPMEIETRAQRWLDAYAGFSKGDERLVFDLDQHRPDDALFPYAAGRFGSGANMAFRAAVLAQMGGFDPALGAGSDAYGGDDLAAFFDVVAGGHRLVYEPSALVHHEHHRDEEALRRVVFGYGAGLTAYLTKTVMQKPSRLLDLVAKAPQGLRHALSDGSDKNRRNAPDYPGGLRRRELIGMAVGPFAYLRSRRRARRKVRQ